MLLTNHWLSRLRLCPVRHIYSQNNVWLHFWHPKVVHGWCFHFPPFTLLLITIPNIHYFINDIMVFLNALYLFLLSCLFAKWLYWLYGLCIDRRCINASGIYYDVHSYRIILAGMILHCTWLATYLKQLCHRHDSMSDGCWSMTAWLDHLKCRRSRVMTEYSAHNLHITPSFSKPQ